MSFNEAIHLLQALGPYFIGLAGLTAAILTIRLVNRKQLKFSDLEQQSEWEKRFLENYIAFWTDEELAKVRYWITNDNGYEKIRPLLARRCAGSKDITEEENAVLENIDRFCARLAAYDVVGKTHRHNEARIPWVSRHREYWSGLIVGRPELKAYMERCWPTLLGTWIETEGGAGADPGGAALASAKPKFFSRRKSRVTDAKPRSPFHS